VELATIIVKMVENKIPAHLSADEKQQVMYGASMTILIRISPTLLIKLGPLVRALIADRQDSDMDSLFAEFHPPEPSLREKSEIYGRMLSRLLDDPNCVSYSTFDPEFLGKMEPKDVWFLTMFVCVTCRRSEVDKLLQLGCSGIPSVGKSTLIESVFEEPML
jgi:hypothetical protein